MHKTEINGRKNIIGLAIKQYRKEHKISTRQLSDYLRRNGLNWDKNAVNRAESGMRVVSDIELVMLLKIIKLTEKRYKNLQYLACMVLLNIAERGDCDN